MEQQGHIRLKRSFLDWRWFKNPNVCHLFTYLLLQASFTDNEFQDKVIKRGQLLISMSKLADNTGLTSSQLRTALHKLSVTHEIITSSSNSSTLITVCNYDSYFELSQTDNNPIAIQSQTDSKPITNQSQHYNNVKNVKNGKEWEKTSTLPKGNVSVPTPETPQKTRKTRKKKSPEEYTLTTQCRMVFENYYQEHYGVPYYWQPKDGANMKRLIEKLKFSRAGHNKEVDDASMVSAFGEFLKLIQSDWIKDNFDVPTINSQYNKIVSAAYNARKSMEQRMKVGVNKELTNGSELGDNEDDFLNFKK